MSYILTHFWPGATEVQYWDEVAAGAVDCGVLIVAIWDSKESSDRFVADVLMAYVPEPGGFSGKPDERGAKAFNFISQ